MHDEALYLTRDGAFSLVAGDAAGGLALVGRTVALTSVRDVGDGKPLAFHLRCTESIVVSALFPFTQFHVVIGNDDSLANFADRIFLSSSMILGSNGILHSAALPKTGDRFEIPVTQGWLGGHGAGQGVGVTDGAAAVPGTLNTVFGRLYIGLLWMNMPKYLQQGGSAGHNYSAGKFDAHLGLAGQGSARVMPIGYTIL